MSRARLAAASTVVVLLGAALTMLGAPKGSATSTSGQLQVRATVAYTCTVTATPMAFGAYSLLNGNTATSTITVSCPSGTSAQVSLDAGQNGSKAAAYGTRAMTANGATYLGYDIYTTGSYGTVWNASHSAAITSSGASVSLIAYGRLPAGQSPKAGLYTDSVTVTVTF